VVARRGWEVGAARRIVFLSATCLLLLSAAAPLFSGIGATVTALIVVNFAIGVWLPVYLTLAQEVSPTHVSTAAGLLGGSGSLSGALAMWAVGRVSKLTGSFAGPLAAVSLAGIAAAAAGLSATRKERTS